MRIYLLLAMAAGASFIGSNCGGAGIGDPCVPEDEYLTTFSGFAVGEVNVESRSFQCLTRVCLVNHFRGRVSCPYGQIEDDFGGTQTDTGIAACAANGDDTCEEGAGSLCADASCQPGGIEHERSCRMPDRDGLEVKDRIKVPVDPQYSDRTAEEAVYCSCRCDGPDAGASYCECPSGFVCEPLVENLGLGKDQLAGSYCVKDGTSFLPTDPPIADCRASAGNCGSTVERVVNGAIIEVGRNPGVSCEAAGTVCREDIYCCNYGAAGVPAHNGTRASRTRCLSEDGGTTVTAGGETVTVCKG